MKFIIVEDEILFAQQLEMIVEKLQYEICGTAESAENALKIYYKEKPDIALIDINLKSEMNGLELGKWFKAFDDNMIIIFITSLQDEKYFEEAKELAAFSFLKKPVDEETLKRTIALATKHSTKSREKYTTSAFEHMFIKNRSKYIKIQQDEILFVEADDKYCNIHTLDGSKHLERITLSKINKKLNPKLFAQTHRSYIANLSKVEEIHPADMTIKIAGLYLPLGESFKQYFLKRIGI